MREQLSTRAILRRAIAIIAWAGLILQLVLSLDRSLAEGQSVGLALVLFVGYFTIVTNFIVCLAVTLPEVSPNSGLAEVFNRPFVCGGITTSITFVSLAYHVLLRHLWHPQGVHLLADTLLHYVVPAVFVMYWFMFVRSGSLRWVDTLLWGAYPSGYFVYVLLRGVVLERYPYRFIDVTLIGYAQTLENAVGLLGVFVVIGLCVVGVDRATRRDR